MSPKLDPSFRPITSVLGSDREVAFHCERPDGTASRTTLVLRENPDGISFAEALERCLKSVLWAQGASRVLIAGADEAVPRLAETYTQTGARAFDADFFSGVYETPLEIAACSVDALPPPQESPAALGRNLQGNRVGFDLGGSDRKCASVIDGEVVFSTEIPWDPYFQSDPSYHRDGIADSIRRAVEALPNVDAIGGSAAGVYVDSIPRNASLFRGVSAADMDGLRNVFHEIAAEYNVPITVINDGDVTALAGSMSLNENAVLGVAMGTSEAVGYVDTEGRITGWLNELAFVPIDLNREAPSDEWSGDQGCGVNYLSQQAVARLIKPAGLEFEVDTTMPYAEQLLAVQALMRAGDERAANIYETIGAYLAYALDWYRHVYEVRHVLLLGRVMSGEGGNLVQRIAEQTLADLGVGMTLHTPDETFKRHGQAIAAASLPAIPS